MFSKEDFSYIPTEYEMSNYINNELWNKFCEFIKSNYNVNPRFEFSKCSLEYGRNVKFKNGSKTLCTVDPRENYFCVMIVIILFIFKESILLFLRIMSIFSSAIKSINY